MVIGSMFTVPRGTRAHGPNKNLMKRCCLTSRQIPSETKNLAAQEPEKLAELKRLYAKWSDEVDAECRNLGLKPKHPAKPK